MNKKFMTAAIAAVVAAQSAHATADPNVNYKVDRFADIEVLRYTVPGFENLSLDQKKMIYYLTEAALAGRDIIWDQNCKVNLPIRDMLEGVYKNYTGDTTSADYQGFLTYLKQVEFANGIHHHYSMDKFTPNFSRSWLEAEVAKLGMTDTKELLDVIFDPTIMPKRVNQADGVDLITTSACNLYGPGVTQADVEAYYAKVKDPNDTTPISYGLNSMLVRDDNGRLTEVPYKLNGMYSAEISRIIEMLGKAAEIAENDTQKAVIEKLIYFYVTGSLKAFDDYSIMWVKDVDSRIDFINGFIESYGDPLGMRGQYESIVNFKNLEASERTHTIADNAQWFEDNSPVAAEFRKKTVKGVSAKVITAAVLAGDSYPSTPIGINLPNANWIRAAHGSKSVTIENITEAYDIAAEGNGFSEEFVIDQQMRDLMKKYGFITDNLHTDLHECLGHASGQLLPGVDPDALKAHGSTLEEARADLFALYYLADPKLLELGLLDNPDAYKAEYYRYMMNGLMTQLVRIEPGKDLEEAHMRNRQIIASWALEHGKKNHVVELVKKSGKTYVKINDYAALRNIFGQLLAEIQRIKSTGDYEAGRQLVEKYGVKVDHKLHNEVLSRYAKLNIAPYKGFVNPVYTPVTDAEGNITDINVTYTEDFLPQVMRYSTQY
jgi:dipeptidyl-peptidase-3